LRLVAFSIFEKDLQSGAVGQFEIHIPAAAEADIHLRQFGHG
jgi:hypothetical protein